MLGTTNIKLVLQVRGGDVKQGAYLLIRKTFFTTVPFSV